MASIVVGTLRAILTLDSAQYEAGMRKMSASAEAFAKDSAKMGRAATQLGASLTRTVSLPLLALGGGAAKAAIDFESSFAGVRKTVNATVPELAAMAQEIRNLAKEIPINVNEINRLAEAAGAMGIPKAAIVDFSKTMALLGVTTNVTSEQAAESIGKIQNIFGAAGKETDRFASTLVALGNDGASTETQILEMATRLAAAGNTIKLTQGEVLAFASALSSVGLEAEMGGSAMSRVFVEIAMAVSQGGVALDQFSQVAGTSAEKFRKDFKEDAASAVTSFIEGLGKIDKSGGDVLAVLKAMGIEEIRMRDTLLRASGAGELLRKALDLQGKSWRENTALTIEAQKRFETTESQLIQLGGRIRDVGITIGNAFLPMIKEATAVLTAWLPTLEAIGKTFANMPMPIQASVVAFGLLLIVLPPLIWAFGQLILSASAIAGAFAIFAKSTIAVRLGCWGIDAAAKASALSLRFLGVSAGVAATAFGLLLGPIAAAIWGFIKLKELKNDKNEMKAWADTGAYAVGEMGVAIQAIPEKVKTAQAAVRGLSGTAEEVYKQMAGINAAREVDDLTAAFNKMTDAAPLTAQQFNKFVEAAQRLKDEGADLGVTLGGALASGLKKVEGASKDGAPVLDAQTFAIKETEKAAKSLAQTLLATFSGGALLEQGKAHEAALKAIGGASKLTAEESEKFVDIFDQVIAKYRLVGGPVGDAVVAHFTALRAQLNQTDAAAQKYLESELRGVEAAKILSDAKDDEARAYLASEQLKLDMMAATDAAATTHLQNELRGYEASKILLDQRDKEANDYLQSELLRFEALKGTAAEDPFAKLMARGLKARQDLVEMWKGVGHQLAGATTAKLGTLFFGQLGHDIDGALKAASREAELDFRKLQRTGKATAKELEVAFEQWREAEDRANLTFAERWSQFWEGIQATFVGILDDMLKHFVNTFLKGVINGIAGAKLGEKLGLSMAGGAAAGGGGSGVSGSVANSVVQKGLGKLLGFGTGGAAGAPLASGVMVNGVLTGVGAGGAAGAAPVVAAVTGTAGATAAGATAAGTAGATGAAGGAGGGLGGGFLANPAFWTNPYTLAAIGGIALGLAVWKKGLFRGGAEATQVSPRRDQFFAQFGGPGTGPDSGFHKLAVKLTEITKQPDGGWIHAKLREADSVKDWDTAQGAAMAALDSAGVKNVKAFNEGGFVPPGGVQNAVLHGGRDGELAAPVGKLADLIGQAMFGRGDDKASPALVAFVGAQTALVSALTSQAKALSGIGGGLLGIFGGGGGKKADAPRESVGGVLGGLFGLRTGVSRAADLGGVALPTMAPPPAIEGGEVTGDARPGPGGAGGGVPSLNQHYTVNINTNALNTDGFDQVFTNDIIPRLQWEFRLNQRGTVSVLEKAMAR